MSIVSKLKPSPRLRNVGVHTAGLGFAGTTIFGAIHGMDLAHLTTTLTPSLVYLGAQTNVLGRPVPTSMPYMPTDQSGGMTPPPTTTDSFL